MKRLLLDTHAFIWWDSDPSQLSAQALAFLADPNNTVLLSVVSAWEMVIKIQLGKMTVRAPLFPRYMFLILDIGRDRWLSVRSTIGVSSLFTCEDRPVPVPKGVVEALIAHTDEANLTRFDAALTTGQTVRILSGPFADLVGTLERLDAAGRVRVLLTMMGTAVPVTLHRSALLPAA